MAMLQWDSNPHGGWAAIVTVFGENLDCRDDRLRVAVFLPFCLPSFIIQHHEMVSLRRFALPARGLGNRCSIWLSYSDEMVDAEGFEPSLDGF